MVFANLTTIVSVLTGVMVLHVQLTVIGAVYCVLILVGRWGAVVRRNVQ
jgi:hypothetical protein